MKISSAFRAAHATGVLLVTLLACVKHDDDATVMVRDSAGIQIVENRAPLWTGAETWTLSPQPVLQIGTDAGAPEYEFTQVWGVHRLPNGHIVVADSVLSFFDSSGKFLRRAGRRGQGPGEIDRLLDLRRSRGDTIVVHSQALRLAVFTGDGAHVRAVNIVPPDSLALIEKLLGFFDDGSFLARTNVAPTRTTSVEPTPDSATVMRFAPDGSFQQIMGRFPIWMRAHTGASPAAMIFGPTGWIVPHGQRFYVGFPMTYQIAVHRADGSLERLIRRAWRPTPVTDGDLQRYRDAWRALRTMPDGRQLSSAELREWMQRLEQAPVASTLPAHSIFLVDHVGNLWVRHYEVAGATYGIGLLPDGDEPAHASVFDPQGRWLGDVAIPPAFYVHDIGEDYFLGTMNDADGVQYVRMYALRKPG
jgi:hypothetical protein